MILQSIEDPRVLHETAIGLSETYKRGSFMRAFPQDGKDWKLLMSLDLHADRFAPAAHHGDGVIVRSSLISDSAGSSSIYDVSLRLPVLSSDEASERGYCAITSELKPSIDYKTIKSMEDSMVGRDAVWIKRQAAKSKFTLSLAIKRSEMLEDE